MEDHQVTYAMGIDIPINRETSKLYSPSKKTMLDLIEEAIRRIKVAIKKDGFVTMERIFRILELRANPECPHVIFSNLGEWKFINDEILSIMLEHDFELLTIPTKKPELRAVKREEFSDEEANDPKDSETDHEDERRQSSKSKGSEQG